MPSSSATCDPRKMFPPPTTIASSAPASTASRTSVAVDSRLPGSIPYPSPPARLSPESLRTTRFTGPSSEPRPAAPSVSASNLSALSKADLELVAREAPDDDVLSDLLDSLLQEIGDRLVRVLHVGLREQGLLGTPLLHATLDNAARYLLGLAHPRRLLLGDRTLLLEGVRRYILRRDAQRPHRGHVQRHVAGELPELGGTRHKVRLAVDLDEHPHPPVEVDVGVDQPLIRLSSALLGCDGLAALSQDPSGAIHVAIRLLEGP